MLTFPLGWFTLLIIFKNFMFDVYVSTNYLISKRENNSTANFPRVQMQVVFHELR